MMNHSLDPTELRSCLPGLYRYANSLTRNGDQALDLVQDSVERALRKAHLFDGVNLRAWLSTICRRAFLNEIRKRNSRGVTIELDESHQQWSAVEPEQDIKLHYRAVIAALEELSPNDHKVITMIAYDGLKYEEAATELGIPTGTVRSRLSRARSRLAGAVDHPLPQAINPRRGAQPELAPLLRNQQVMATLITHAAAGE